ncbi:MFS transporter [Clostridium manihotivorum]|uniref:Major facilitator superfamily (MFS) profile domain-containing protein n=1 Tax=Clostridium manihotivorum TaxID=2320868 RepID=A0A410DNZ3_9CLOT|nr:MFS transporter [Clostridium manihotivorum]QAA30789.1 hypothetical protein C1I91_03460 [Clostridium manihotivorum]
MSLLKELKKVKRRITYEKRLYNRNSLLYLLAIIFFYICNGAFSMLQGIYLKEAGMSEGFLGVILSVKTITIALGAIPCAIIVSKIGKKKGLLIAMFIIPITIILQGITSNNWTVLFLSAIQGLVNAFIVVSEGPFLMENSNERTRLQLFSYVFSTNVFSTMVGYFAFGSVSRTLEGVTGGVNSLRYSIIASGVIGIFSAIFILKIKSVKEVNTKENTKDFIKHIIRLSLDKYPLRLLIYNSIIGFGAGLVVPYFNVYLKYKVNASTAQIGLIMALAQFAMGFGGLLTPVMSKKFGRVKTINLCQIVSIPFLLLIALPPNLYIVAMALFMRNGLMNMSGPVVGTITMELIEGEERSMFASVNNIFSNVSRAISTALGGIIMYSLPHGYEIPYIITAIMYIIATVVFHKSFSFLDYGVKVKKKIIV